MIIPIELRFKADKDSKSAFRTEKTIKSHDVNSIEFHITIEGLELTENHTAKILSKFHSSKSQVNVDCEIVDGEIIYKPDTNLISRFEHVTSYVYVYNGNQSLDVCEFTYIVDLSKIDETSLEVKEVYDQSYADLLAGFEQALSDYKDNLPQADSVRAEIDEILNQFSEDSQAKLSQYDTDVQQVIADNQTAFDLAESARQDSYVQAESERNQLSTQAVGDWSQGADALLDTVESDEAIRVTAETARKTAETDRVSSESTRKTNETTRVSNEDARKSAEFIRLASEADRVSAEFERISKDSERDSKIEEIERVATKPPEPIHTLKVENEVFSSDEVSVSEGVITIINHNLKVGDKVAFVATATSYNVSVSFDGAMRLNTVYYVVDVSSDSFQISTTQNGEPIVFNIDTKGFLWQFEKVSVNSLQVRGLEGTKYRAVFTGAHEGNRLSKRMLNAYTNPGNVFTRYSSEDIQNTITSTDIYPVHGVTDIYSEMIFKVINRKILITVDSSFTTIGETTGNHSEETYRNRILTRTNNPTVGFQDSIRIIGVGGQHLFDGSTLEVYEL